MQVMPSPVSYTHLDVYKRQARFDFDLFRRHARAAQRIMDDIVDLEMEKIDQIMDKIKHDPQSDEVKEAEYHLWEKIRHKSGQGRRIGVGITAEGDMLAAMGLRYGTQEATDFSVEVHLSLIHILFSIRAIPLAIRQCISVGVCS